VPVWLAEMPGHPRKPIFDLSDDLIAKLAG
jgi:hypothetical protein